MNTFEWIDQSLQKVGYHDTCKSYSKFVLETPEPYCSVESFTRMVRNRRQKIDGSTQPKEPKDVSTPTQATDFHDVDLAKYDITGVRINTWGSEQNQNKQVRLDLKTKVEGIDYEKIIESFREEVKAHHPASHHPPVPRMVDGQLLEISIPDLHFGLLSWHRETGADYDIHIARRVYLEAIDRMLVWAVPYKLEKILLVIGHDFFNSDTPENTTTKGTRQDDDSRWPKTFEEGWKTVRDAVEKCLCLAPVKVLVIRGNHDTQRAFFLGEVIKAWFSQNPKVDVDNEPTDYKVFQFGKCLIGHTHGHLCKHEKLPGIFATDFSAMWGETIHRVVRVGHGHVEEVKSYPGMTVEMVPSLGAPSAWTASSGYRSIRSAHAYIWDKENGNQYIFKHKPGM